MLNFSMTTKKLFEALVFAASKHRDQRRKDAPGSPYINHPIGVANLLAGDGNVADEDVLLAAVLHDTIEDTNTTFEELAAMFGPRVAGFVREVTDDRALPKQTRKQLQIEHAPHLSEGAKHIKLADKICNVRDIVNDPPADWPIERRLDYFDWAERVVAGCRGANPALEKAFDDALAEGRKKLSG
jgi:guanosine-3',5'-bis(diphosphate) 3'-pyrophosphohydrolase